MSDCEKVKIGQVFDSKEGQNYSKSISVPETSEHEDGFTLYKIILQALPHNSLDQDAVYFVRWARYKDLHKLWIRLSTAHQQLHLRGEFPDFPKPKIFGKHDPLTVEERREAAERFLDFAVKHTILNRGAILVEFFQEAGTKSEFEFHSPDLSPVLEPTSFFMSSPTKTPSGLPQSSSSSDTPQSSSFISDMSLFDPYNTSSISDSDPHYNQCLLESMDKLQVTEESVDPELLFPEPPEDSSLSVPSSGQRTPVFSIEDCSLPPTDIINIEDDKKQKHAHPYHDNQIKTQEKKHRNTISRFFPKITSPIHLKTHQSPTVMKHVRSEGNLAEKKVEKSPENRKRRQFPSPLLGFVKNVNQSSRFVSKSINDDDYLVQAAHFISSAQKSEAEGAHELAFSCYKSAINLLLQGVQEERDLSRRNAVRKKTAKYLLKAERLYRSYLAFDSTTFDVDKWAVTVTAPSVQDPTLIAFQGSTLELRGLHYICCLYDDVRIQLVQDKQSDIHYALKFLDKTCHFRPQNLAQISENFVPIQVPHMVQLVKFYETDTCVILLLEYVPTGRLWDFLDDYFKSSQESLNFTQNSNNDLHSESDNRYVGKKISFSVSEGKPSIDSCDDIEGTETEVFADIIRKANKRCVGAVSSIESTDSFNVDIGPSNSTSLQSPNPEFRFQNVFNKISSGFEDFSIIDEEPLDSVQPTVSLEDSAIEICDSSVSVQSDEHEKTVDSPENDHIWTLEMVRIKIKDLLRRNKKWSSDWKLPECQVKLWIAQLINALAHLHAEGVIVKDLRPDNLLLNENGDLVLTYCSEWACVDKKQNLDAWEFMYSAPEVGLEPLVSVNECCDWWSVGAICYELLTKNSLYSQCLHGFSPRTVIPFNEQVSDGARDFIERLLTYNPLERLGREPVGVDEIKDHPFFVDINWYNIDKQCDNSHSTL